MISDAELDAAEDGLWDSPELESAMLKAALRIVQRETLMYKNEIFARAELGAKTFHLALLRGCSERTRERIWTGLARVRADYGIHR